jgi:hypothetical protein
VGILSATQFRIFCLPHLLSINVKIKVHKTITLHVVLYGYETHLTLMERTEIECVWKQGAEGIFGENCMMSSSIICIFHQISLK